MKYLLCFTFLLMHSVCAAHWPTFTPPSTKLLMQLNDIDTKECPPNQGKILNKSEVNIKQYLCKGDCPADWTWVVESDGLCHNLNDFTLQKIIIHYHQNSTKSLTNYSVIEAFYGLGENAKTNTDTWAKYSVATAPDEHWFCIVVNMENEVLGCQNDIRKFTPNIDRH